MQNINFVGREENKLSRISVLNSFFDHGSTSSHELLLQLQTSLAPQELLNMFAVEVSKFVDFAGLSFSTDSKTFTLQGSRRAKIQKRYKLSIEGQLVGILTYNINSIVEPSIERLLSKLHNVLSYPMRNALAFEEAKQQALSDSLTLLSNRREFDRQATKAMNRANRSGTAVGLMLLDLNKFKKINDTYGHHVGDSVLVNFAKALESSVREADSVFRLGGDEFAILVENASHKSIKIIEARLNKFCKMNPTLNKYQVAFASGYSTLRKEDTIDAMMVRADKRLYQDKFDDHKVVSIA